MSVPETLTLPSPDSSLVLGQVLLREWVLIKKEAEYIEWDEETKKENDNTFAVIDTVLNKLNSDSPAKIYPFLLTLTIEEVKIMEYLLENRMVRNTTYYSNTICKKTKAQMLAEIDIINDLLKQLLRMANEH
jgi:hypothetical protein